MADSKTDYLLRKQEELRLLNERLEREYDQQALEVQGMDPGYSPQQEDPYQEEEFQREEDQDLDRGDDQYPAEEEKAVDEAFVMAQDLGELREQLSEAQSIIKIQKARIQALQDELNDVLSQNNSQALEIQRLKGSHQEATEETKKQSAQMTQISQNFEKMKKQLQESQRKLNEQEKVMSDLNKVGPR